MKLAQGTAVEFVVGDLMEQRVDGYIVPFGDPDGTSSRVQQHIRRIAHAGLGEEIARQLALLPGGRMEEGECIVTPAPGLLCEHLIHCHLVSSSTDRREAASSLLSALGKALTRSRDVGATSVALPAIGTGAYGLSSQEVAYASVRAALAVQEVDSRLTLIRLVLSSSRTLAEFLVARSDYKE